MIIPLLRELSHNVSQMLALLPTQPWIGRPGRIDDTREWVVKQTPYLLVYAIEDNELQIVGVTHSKQRWPDAFR